MHHTALSQIRDYEMLHSRSRCEGLLYTFAALLHAVTERRVARVSSAEAGQTSSEPCRQC